MKYGVYLNLLFIQISTVMSVLNWFAGSTTLSLLWLGCVLLNTGPVLYVLHRANSNLYSGLNAALKPKQKDLN